MADSAASHGEAAVDIAIAITGGAFCAPGKHEPLFGASLAALLARLLKGLLLARRAITAGGGTGLSGSLLFRRFSLAALTPAI